MNDMTSQGGSRRAKAGSILLMFSLFVFTCVNIWFTLSGQMLFRNIDAKIVRPIPSDKFQRPDIKPQYSSLAHEIIMNAYHRTYSILVDFCHPNFRLQNCMNSLYKTHYEVLVNSEFFRSNTNNKYLNGHELDPYSYNPGSSMTVIRESPPPWWFFTLLRDGSGPAGNIKRDNITFINGGLFGAWHEALAENPGVSMCMMEKNGVTQWRKVFFKLNGGFEPNATKKMPFLPQRLKPEARIRVPLSKSEFPSFVFLRDPLERFLSAYIDKCYKPVHRRSHLHCEPNILFNNPSTKDTLMKGLYNQTDGAILQAKEAFEMYVDTIPLKWNMHFIPQSLYCDGIYRTLDDFDFVGTMGPQFYKDLHTLSNRYGGRFGEEVHKVFDLDKHVAENTINQGVETSAPKYVKIFYSPRSLRRVLEYLSIDYIFLGMDVPHWAHEILEHEKDQFGSAT